MTTQLVIEKLLNNGQGMARLADGRVVFVADALPGETVVAETLRKKRGVFWAQNIHRITVAPSRQVPPCPHDAQCGGCRLLHVRASAEALYKANYLDDALRRIAKSSAHRIQLIDYPWPHSRIRAKFHVKAGHLGFTAAEGHRIADLETCAVLPQTLVSLLAELRHVAQQTDFLGTLQVVSDPAGQMVIADWQGKGSGSQTAQRLHVMGLAGTMWRCDSGELIDATGTTAVTFNWLGHRVNLQPRDFFQSNPTSWPLFWQWVRHFQARYQPSKVWDVHSGAGFLSAALQPVALWCTEPNQHTAAKAEKLNMLGFSPLHVICNTAEGALAQGMIPNDLDAVILDPPRTGCESALREYLIEQGPRAMLYISCDMGSFARDLRELTTAYHMDSPVYAANLNPGTLRLETALLLRRKTRQTEGIASIETDGDP